MITSRVFRFILIPLAFAMGIFPSSAESEPRGGRVEWARLKTSDQHWNRHTEAEKFMLNFIRKKTTFDIDPQWRAADVEDLRQLCSYPLLFSQGIQMLKEQAKKNLGEYLRRGGFLFIDACCNTGVTPDPDIFLKQQLDILREVLPGSQVEQLPGDDPIYSNFFQMKEGLPHSYMASIYDPVWAKHGLYCVTFEDRAIALISLSGLKCGWAKLVNRPNHDIQCMQMMVNIYIYALTH